MGRKTPPKEPIRMSIDKKRLRAKKEKALKFVEHIEKHLKEMIWTFPDDAKVTCKICGKTIDEICEESK